MIEEYNKLTIVVQDTIITEHDLEFYTKQRSKIWQDLSVSLIGREFTWSYDYGYEIMRRLG
jgi:hypothetical protein